jgi:acetylornithine deacetylase/succinyl-diaminopimelate desuccinylase-like protein
VAALCAWLESAGRLPLNVKVLAEGEEEIGSPGLERFLDAHGKELAADVAVLADTGNFDVGHPALTYQLRGICQVDVEVRCLERPVHSGFFGGPTPDAVRILARLVASLEKKDGSLDVPGLYRDVATPGARQLKRIRSLPFSEKKFRASAAHEARHALRRRARLLGVGAAVDAPGAHRHRARGARDRRLVEPGDRRAARAAVAADGAAHGESAAPAPCS